MSFVFGFAGVLLITAGVRGQTSNLFALVKSDFTGQPNYFEWMVAIFLTGSIGYIKELSTISRMFMFLVLAGLLYQHRTVLEQLATQEAQQPSTTQTTVPTTATNPVTLPSLPTVPATDNFSSSFSEVD